MNSGGEVTDSRLLRKYKEGAAFGEWGGGVVSLYCAVPAEGTTLCQDVAAREFQRAEQRFHTPAAAAAVGRTAARSPFSGFFLSRWLPNRKS